MSASWAWPGTPTLSERGGYQSTPLVIDGRIYVTTPWSKVYAFDAKTGKPLWKIDPEVPREIAGAPCAATSPIAASPTGRARSSGERSMAA